MKACCFLTVSRSKQAKLLTKSSEDWTEGYSHGETECGCGLKWTLAWVELSDAK